MTGHLQSTTKRMASAEKIDPPQSPLSPLSPAGGGQVSIANESLADSLGLRPAPSAPSATVVPIPVKPVATGGPRVGHMVIWRMREGQYRGGRQEFAAIVLREYVGTNERDLFIIFGADDYIEKQRAMPAIDGDQGYLVIPCGPEIAEMQQEIAALRRDVDALTHWAHEVSEHDKAVKAKAGKAASVADKAARKKRR